MGKKNKPAVKSAKPPVHAANLHAKPARTARLMQDIRRPVQAVPKAREAQPDSPAAHIPKVRPSRAMDIVPPAQIKHHQTQSAQTLMRSAVSKPQPGLKRRFGTRTPTDVLIKQPEHQVVLKWPVTAIDPAKAKHSKQIHKSKLITRFAPQSEKWYETRGHLDAAVKTYAPTHLASLSSEASARGETPAEPNRSMDIFERAIQHANSHEQPKFNPRKEAKTAHKAAKAVHKRGKPVHHRLSSVVSASLAFLLLAGFIAYQNKASITMRFADAKAGFHASLPTYKPSGFAVGKFRYGSGSVAVNYAQNGTNRSYQFSQTTSNLDSQTVLSSLVAPHSTSYQTLQYGGRTIFIYGNNNAAWVDEGILYQITSNGSLSTSDILSIAKSV